jgi:hypothetical protein
VHWHRNKRPGEGVGEELDLTTRIEFFRQVVLARTEVRKVDMYLTKYVMHLLTCLPNCEFNFPARVEEIQSFVQRDYF